MSLKETRKFFAYVPAIAVKFCSFTVSAEENSSENLEMGR